MSGFISSARVSIACLLLASGGALIAPPAVVSAVDAHPDCTLVEKDIEPGQVTTVAGVVWVKASTELFNLGFQDAGFVIPSTAGGHDVSHGDVCAAPSPTTVPVTEAPTTAPGTEAPTTAPGTEAPTTSPPTTAVGGVSPTTLVGGDIGQVPTTTAPPSGASGTLPVTGSSSSTSVVLGSILLLLGSAVLVAGRRQSPVAD